MAKIRKGKKVKRDRKNKGRESRDYSIVMCGLVFYSRSTETATGVEDEREVPFFTLICFYCPDKFE